MRTNDQIKEIVEGAFKPLRCVAEIFDYDKKLRFRVFDANSQPIVTVPDLVLSLIRDNEQLAAVVNQARERIEEKGFALSAWSLE